MKCCSGRHEWLDEVGVARCCSGRWKRALRHLDAAGDLDEEGRTYRQDMPFVYGWIRLPPMRGIAFSPAMYSATVRGDKTQTRRVITRIRYPGGMRYCGKYYTADRWFVEPDVSGIGWMANGGTGPIDERMRQALKEMDDTGFPCPYGKPGDVLWVKEALVRCAKTGFVTYAHDGMATARDWPWKPSRLAAMYMPLWAARLFIKIVSIRAERLQDISGPDCLAEGIPQEKRLQDGVPLHGDIWRNAKASYRDLWDSINAKRDCGWDTNPWVWRIEFAKTEKPT